MGPIGATRQKNCGLVPKVPTNWSVRLKTCLITYSKIKGLTVGEWLSLVEHLVRDQGVGGSNPLSPTNLISIIRAGWRRNHGRFICHVISVVPNIVPTQP